MNLAKAKDYFSAYYEGSLDRGLKQSFEMGLREDAQLQAEYRAFVRTMQDLQALGHVEIEPPADLHDKIAARLDRIIWEEKREKAPALSMGWWKGLLAVSAVAAGLVFAFLEFGHSNTSQANIIGSFGSAADQFTFGAGDHEVTLSYPQVDHQTIIIKDASGLVKETDNLDHQPMDSKPLKNQGDSPQLLSVETADQSVPVSYIAIPGKLRDSALSGKGTVKELAVALAGHYQKAVVVQARDDADKDTSWDFSTGDAMAAAEGAVKPLNLSVSEKLSGVIMIQKN